MAHPRSSRGRTCAATASAALAVVLAAATSAAAQAPESRDFAGDGGLAERAKLALPTAVAVTADGGYLIADSANNRIRRVSPQGIITTVAGTGAAAFSGDGGDATAAALNLPSDVAVLPGGGFLIADTANNRIRRVDPDGTIRTIAGTGTAGSTGDKGPATAAQIDAPQGVDITPEGTVIFSDTRNDRIREIGAGGIITTVAGGGKTGLGDGGPATDAMLSRPVDVVATAHGFVIADSAAARVRAVTFGAITTIAGTGSQGFDRDDRRGPFAALAYPAGLALQSDGSLLIADTGNQRVRRLRPRGFIVTAAGVGTAGVSAEGARAQATKLAYPNGVAATADGGFLIANTNADRILRVRPGGTVDVVVGGGVPEIFGPIVGFAGGQVQEWRFLLARKPRSPKRNNLQLCLSNDRLGGKTTVVIRARKGTRNAGRTASFSIGNGSSICRTVRLRLPSKGRYDIIATATFAKRAKTVTLIKRLPIT